VTVGDGVGDAVTVYDGVGDGTLTSICVGVDVSVGVGVTVAVGDGLSVGVTVGFGDGLAVGVGVHVADGVGVEVAVGGSVGVIVKVGVGNAKPVADGVILNFRLGVETTNGVKVGDTNEPCAVTEGTTLDETSGGVDCATSGVVPSARGNLATGGNVAKAVTLAVRLTSPDPEVGDSACVIGGEAILYEKLKRSATGQNNHNSPPQTAIHSTNPVRPAVTRPLEPLRRTSRVSGPRRWVPLAAAISNRGPRSSTPGGITKSNVRQRSASPTTGFSLLSLAWRSNKHLAGATAPFIGTNDTTLFQ